MNCNKFRIASLFCGCGGADVGLVGGFTFNKKKYQKLPTRHVYASDIDANAIRTYRKNFVSDVISCADICDVSSDEIPDHDVLVGGFPCQSFSTVNPTKDPFDDRANLFKQMVRILRDKKPMAFIGENVKGMMTLHKGSIFRKIVSSFEDSGYQVSYQLINAADYGVPQKRERVIIVGIRNDVCEKIGSFRFPEAPNLWNWVPLSVAVHSLIPDNPKYYFSERAVQGMKNAKNNMKRGLAQNLDEPCLTVTSHLAKVSLNSRDPVLLVDPDKELYRRFTPREAARIQSFPDSFEFVGSESAAYKQIGNAIPPVLMWHIASALCAKLSEYQGIT